MSPQRYTLTSRPDYRTLFLRDVDCYAIGDSLILDAGRQIAACSGYQVCIIVTQEMVDIHAEAEVWDTPPASGPHSPGWTGPLSFALDCPTGHLVMGDGFGHDVIEIRPPAGPGRYIVEVYHQGREDGLRAFQEVLEVLGEDDEQTAALQGRYAGAEQYLVRLWLDSPLPPSEDDDEGGG